MKQVKKLVLSKETLAVLTDEQVGMVGGGRAISEAGACQSIPCGTDACNVSGACGGGGATDACASGGCAPGSAACYSRVCDPSVNCLTNRCNGTRGCIVNR